MPGGQLPFHFLTPAQPALTPILMIHRLHDGWIAFGSKDEAGAWSELYSIKAADLRGVFPQLLPDFERDSYFTVNAFYRPKRGRSPRSPDGLDLPRAEHGGGALRWLTCCFADVDFYGLGLSLGQAVGAVIDAQEHGAIPPASLLVNSGRGLWCLWILCGEDGRTPERAWPSAVRLWSAAQRKILERLAAIGADAQSLDVSRFTRIPGSVNTKALRRVGWWVQGDKSGGFTYRLAELAAGLGVQLRERTPELDKQIAFLTARAKSGHRKRWLNAREDFELLWELRGGFRVGTRNAAVAIYTTILRQLGLEGESVEAEVRSLVADFEQPAGERYTAAELQATVRSAKRRRLTNQTIGNWLRVTPQEAELLKGFPAAAEFKGSEPEQRELTATERRIRRRQVLRSLVADLGLVPKLKRLQAHLADLGLECAFRTVADDLVAIGVKNPRGFKRKPQADDGEKLLFD